MSAGWEFHACSDHADIGSRKGRESDHRARERQREGGRETDRLREQQQRTRSKTHKQ